MAGPIVNLAHTQAASSRSASLTLIQEGPDRTIEVLRHFQDRGNKTMDLFPELSTHPMTPRHWMGASQNIPNDSFAVPALHTHLTLPSHHDVKAADIDLKRLHGTLRAASERGPKDFAQLLLTPGVGARTVTALAFVAEVVHGAPCAFSDPARFSWLMAEKTVIPFLSRSKSTMKRSGCSKSRSTMPSSIAAKSCRPSNDWMSEPE